jgi:hypothetical protein
MEGRAGVGLTAAAANAAAAGLILDGLLEAYLDIAPVVHVLINFKSGVHIETHKYFQNVCVVRERASSTSL